MNIRIMFLFLIFIAFSGFSLHSFVDWEECENEGKAGWFDSVVYCDEDIALVECKGKVIEHFKGYKTRYFCEDALDGD